MSKVEGRMRGKNLLHETDSCELHDIEAAKCGAAPCKFASGQVRLMYYVFCVTVVQPRVKEVLKKLGVPFLTDYSGQTSLSVKDAEMLLQVTKDYFSIKNITGFIQVDDSEASNIFCDVEDLKKMIERNDFGLGSSTKGVEDDDLPLILQSKRHNAVRAALKNAAAEDGIVMLYDAEWAKCYFFTAVRDVHKELDEARRVGEQQDRLKKRNTLPDVMPIRRPVYNYRRRGSGPVATQLCSIL